MNSRLSFLCESTLKKQSWVTGRDVQTAKKRRASNTCKVQKGIEGDSEEATGRRTSCDSLNLADSSTPSDIRRSDLGLTESVAELGVEGGSNEAVEWDGVADIGRSFWRERATDMLTCHERGGPKTELGVEFSLLSKLLISPVVRCPTNLWLAVVRCVVDPVGTLPREVSQFIYSQRIQLPILERSPLIPLPS
jgi:hypothetical protein